MNIFKKWSIIILFFITIPLIILNIKNKMFFTKIDQKKNNDQPDHQINNSTTFIYSTNGNLIYKFFSDKTNNYNKKKTTLFLNPILITYNKKGIPTWKIKSLKSKLINTNIIYFYNNVQINNLIKKTIIQQITTKNAIFNLTTKDFFSDEKTIIIGHNLLSNSLKIKINFCNETIELIKDVKTSYKIKK
ncbi:LPS export ABC transporter periplasmic protein LptC [Candidatus Providencia siddallii]|uniref:Lipopolysaccharide export system protein LptC n=1 Tax=Candidatus Providencia siddallii TaxID=1715285 RepID=A0ABP1CE26_9GAMM